MPHRPQSNARAASAAGQRRRLPLTRAQPLPRVRVPACPRVSAGQDGDAFADSYRPGPDPRPFRWVIGSDIVYHQQHDFRHIQARACQRRDGALSRCILRGGWGTSSPCSVSAGVCQRSSGSTSRRHSAPVKKKEYRHHRSCRTQALARLLSRLEGPDTTILFGYQERDSEARYPP